MVAHNFVGVVATAVVVEAGVHNLVEVVVVMVHSWAEIVVVVAVVLVVHKLV